MSDQGRSGVETKDLVLDLAENTVSVLGAPVHAQVLAHMRDAVMLIDADGVVSYASPNVDRVLGEPVEAWIGQPLLDSFTEPDVGAVERALTRAISAPPDRGALLFGNDVGPVMLYVDLPQRLGPLGTRLLTFRPTEFAREPAEPRGHSIEAESGATPFDPIEADELATALEAGQLAVHYQPEIDLETGLVLGAEALVRWEHPDRGRVTAADFVELAEASGLIGEIGRLVLRRSCAEFGSWAHRFGGTVLTLRVNLSAAQLADPTLVDVVEQALDDAGLHPDSLCVEVTETTLMSDPVALEVLSELRQFGVEAAVDDFGTGFSSLSQLKRLPVDVLKIDRSFVSGLGLAADDTAITRAIVELARAVGLGVVAEGIEHPRQVDELLRLGCRRGQGWLYAGAMPWDQLETEYLLT